LTPGFQTLFIYCCIKSKGRNHCWKCMDLCPFDFLLKITPLSICEDFTRLETLTRRNTDTIKLLDATYSNNLAVLQNVLVDSCDISSTLWYWKIEYLRINYTRRQEMFFGYLFYLLCLAYIEKLMLPKY